MTRKPKFPQKESLTEVSGRDSFQTPNYAVDLLNPFLQQVFPTPLYNENVVWECAVGLGKIIKRLSVHGFNAIGTDLAYGTPLNFLTDEPNFKFHTIVTNPPFSLKRKFFEKCLEYDVPFALLIPADYTGWLIEAVWKYGCEKIIPTRRIDYITPNILTRIHEGEIWETVKKKYPGGAVADFEKHEDFKKEFPVTWQGYLSEYKDFCVWTSIYDTPVHLLRKYSSSYYHSMWLTRYFDLGKTETFVELSNEDKNNI